MIDAHIHVVPPNLPDVGDLGLSAEGGPAQIADWLMREMRSAEVTQALAMGELSEDERDLFGVRSTLQLAERVPGLMPIGVIHPERSEGRHLDQAKAILKEGRIKALKVYLGYIPFGADHDGYRPYYTLAGELRIPVIFHTGDTASPSARLRLAHPLTIDEIAVEHRQTDFVIAHVGNPWMRDAVEVVHKNFNVWTDLSGLVVGSASDFEAEHRQDMLADVRHDLGRAFRYAERPNRFLYGSDWPLAPMRPYRQLIQQSIPSVYHSQIFEDNARLLFRLGTG